jgi:hypothetical protein
MFRQPDRLDSGSGSGRGFKKTFENCGGKIPEERRHSGAGNLILMTPDATFLVCDHVTFSKHE